MHAFLLISLKTGVAVAFTAPSASSVLSRPTAPAALSARTSLLDWRTTLARLDLPRRLSDQDGFIVVIALHDLNLALACASRALVLGKGRLGADGRPDTALSLEVIAEVWLG